MLLCHKRKGTKGEDWCCSKNFTLFLKSISRYWQKRKILNHNTSYPIELWNVYERIELQMPRIPNNVKSFNKTLNQFINKKPNIAQFINELCTIEDLDIIKLKCCHKGIYKLKSKSLEIVKEKNRCVGTWGPFWKNRSLLNFWKG
jgi:hypothetical protein